jgi:dCMP deaminase
MPKTQPIIVAAYVPVLHRGYMEFLRKQKPQQIYLFGKDLLKELDYLRKDLRALDPLEMAPILEASLRVPVSVITRQQLEELATEKLHWMLPKEDISRQLAEKYLDKADVTFKPVFLRWNRDNVEVPDASRKVVTTSKPLDKKRMQQAYDQTGSSPDLWRRVGATLYDAKGKLLDSACNQPGYAQQTPLMDGDPRNVFKQGVGIEMSSFLHAEAAVVAAAARQGRSLKGTYLYTTTFPCPACAMLIAKSGISHFYYAEGYGVLHGEQIMETAGVQVAKVAIKPPKPDPDEAIPYIKS